jgi:glutamine phosphoribosylpyrophosphate amidotransferase
MCGVLGITIKGFKNEDCDLIRSLFHQSMIRGKHAAGVSYVKGDRVHTDKQPIPADSFIDGQDINSWVNEDGNLYCIGHVRYSTSDLRYNQPFSSPSMSIVHNGVITQDSPKSWEASYGLKTKTANDSELILRALENDEEPLTYFRPSSMAVCCLSANKTILAFRNEARPLYYYVDDRMAVFTSTADIAKRSGVNNPIKARMYTIHKVENFEIDFFDIKTNVEDLQ